MTELQNDRMTDRTKTICPPVFDLGGIITKETHSFIYKIFFKLNLRKSGDECVNQITCVST